MPDVEEQSDDESEQPDETDQSDHSEQHSEEEVDSEADEQDDSDDGDVELDFNLKKRDRMMAGTKSASAAVTSNDEEAPELEEAAVQKMIAEHLLQQRRLNTYAITNDFVFCSGNF